MNREQYIQLRKSLNFERRASASALLFAQDAVLIAAIIGWSSVFADDPLRFAMIPMISILLFRNFSHMHEATHGLVARHRFLNDLVGTICGAVCFLPFELWKRGHLEHHLWGGNIEKDPVMAIPKTFHAMPWSFRKFVTMAWNAWFPIIALLQHFVFWGISLGHFARDPRSLRTFTSLVAPLILWGALPPFLPAAFTLQILLPAVFLYLVAVEVVNLPHHLELPHFRGEEKLPAWEQYQIARTCLYPRWLARFVALNFNYHVEHHVFPDAPWYRLEEIHHALRARLGQAYNSDPQFAWIRKNRPRSMDDVVAPTAKKKAAGPNQAA